MPENLYIQSAELNGAPLDQPWFAEKEILSGGEWKVVVGPQPNTQWGANPFDRPFSLSTGGNFSSQFQGTPLLPPAPDGKGGAVWRYTTTAPSTDWAQLDFADGEWKQGVGGFGTEDVGVDPRTPWEGDDIWMRATFTLGKPPARAALSVYHDADAEVYLNGQLVAKVSGYVHVYTLVKTLAAGSSARLFRQDSISWPCTSAIPEKDATSRTQSWSIRRPQQKSDKRDGCLKS